MRFHEFIIKDQVQYYFRMHVSNPNLEGKRIYLRIYVLVYMLAFHNFLQQITNKWSRTDQHYATYEKDYLDSEGRKKLKDNCWQGQQNQKKQDDTNKNKNKIK